ncbi:MAG TPA: hypothetical protein VHF90_06020 [Thermoleophilaceae bacterium]|nr:hypothetical protein [Thermoleophilaceae bacterium]
MVSRSLGLDLGGHLDDPGVLASAQALGAVDQQLTWGRALVVSGSLPPAVVRFHPHWRDPQLQAA